MAVASACMHSSRYGSDEHSSTAQHVLGSTADSRKRSSTPGIPHLCSAHNSRLPAVSRSLVLTRTRVYLQLSVSMPGVPQTAAGRKRPRDDPRAAHVRRNVQSVFTPSSSVARKRTAKQSRVDARSAQPALTLARPPPLPSSATARLGEVESDARTVHEPVTAYRAMMLELASRARLHDTQAAAQQTAEGDGAAQEDEEKEEEEEEETAEDGAKARSLSTPRRNSDGDEQQQQPQQAAAGSEEEEEADGAEGDDDEVSETEERTAQPTAQLNNTALKAEAEQASGGDSVVGEEEDCGDIDDLTQPATLLLAATEADDELLEARPTASLSPDSSSAHAELQSSDCFLSHFSHHRTLSVEVLAALADDGEARLQPYPPLDGMRERLFALNIDLLAQQQAAEQHTQQKQQQSAERSEQHESQAAERSVEASLGVPKLSAPLWLRELHVRARIVERWQSVTSRQKSRQRRKLAQAAAASSASTEAVLDDDVPHPLQRALLPLLSTYRDVVYPCMAPSAASSTFTPATHAAVMQAYCLHVVNHVVRAREAVLRHNAKLTEWHKRQQEKRDAERLERQQQKQQARLSKDGQPSTPSSKQSKQRVASSAADAAPLPSLPPEYRDQGFTRCRVLLLLPYAHFAYSAINCILSLLPSAGRVDILNRRRFEAEFSGAELAPPDTDKPADYRYLMTGELNDAFRVGVSLGSRGVRLYAPFHASDIIVASPLGLKLLLDGSEGHDWLSSVEVLVMDQCDVFGMQNWQHVDSLLQALNQLPRGHAHTQHSGDEESSGKAKVARVEMDISRVKNYHLDSHARYYRQTIVLANHLSTDIHHLATRQLHNYAGLLLLRPLYGGVLTRIRAPLRSNTQRQIFNRFAASSLQRMPDERFDYFTQHIFPTLKQNYEAAGHIMIVVPAYSDFLRLRNRFKARHYNYCALSEYTTAANVSRHRSNFYHGRVKYLLVTERFYFYRRYLIKGVSHLVFYALPQYASCYEELVNALGVGVGAAAGAAASGLSGSGLVSGGG